MYTVILIILLGPAAFFVMNGIMKRKTGRIILGVIIGALTLFFFWFMDFWGEMLWFQSIGHEQRFWIEILAKIIFIGVGAIIGWLTVFILTSFIPRQKKYTRLIARTVGALIGGLMGISNWDLILRYLNRVSANLSDPILGRDVSFYLFTLPFYDILYN
jgi:uncharacterized membrane protein (UPF0182 family)